MPVMDPRYHDPLLGVAFDLDGTLVLSNHPFERMRREVIRIAEQHGVVPGHLSTTQNIPTLVDTAIRELEHAGSPEGARYRFEGEANRRIDEIEMESLPSTTARPGAPALLRALAEKGYRLGVLTRSSATFAHEALKRAGLLPYIPRIRTRTDTGPAKPDPEALLSLLRIMEVPPQRAVYVGDHLLDAECAGRARVRFYAVLPPSPTALGTDVDRFKAAGATAIAPSLEELGRQLGVLLPASPPAAAPR